MAPARLHWRQEPRSLERRQRQSRRDSRPQNTMSLPITSIYLSLNVLLACAKIHGGPRGRFDPPLNRTNYQHVSAHHTHYSYHPPPRISFICRHCSTVATYPVFHGSPPSYVYKFRESNSRYSELLTGLALYNLGRISEYWHHTHYYTRRPDEKCSLQVIDRARFEETIVPCFMMSSFLPDSETKGPDTFDVMTAHIKVKSFLNNTGGAPLFVNREQQCVIWHNTTEKTEKNVIACALLKEYSNTMRPAGIPVYIWLPITLIIVLGISTSCQFCCRKKKSKEDSPLYVEPVVTYTEP